MISSRVVVTGMGALTPIGLGLSAYWEGLINGVSGCDTIKGFDASKFKTRIACELKGFDIHNHMDKKEARKMDPFCHYAIVAADEAIAHAKLNLDQIDKTRVAVIMGSGIGGLKTFQTEVTDFAKGDGTPRFNPFFIPKMIIDIAPGHISIKYGFKGPNYSCVSACATSTNCIIDAYMLIKMGLADVVIAGGAEAAVNEVGVGGFSSMKAMSERNDDPKTASRPFDKDRDGFILGEGGGAIILESLAHAQKRGATIYAEMLGVGLTADAYHITAPSGEGAERVMQIALDTAQLKASDIDYINVHGTSTPLGDIAETNAIKKVFGTHAQQLSISSSKSMTGHLLGAAGVIEAIATIMAVKHDLIPPTINHFTDDPECDLDYTFNTARSKTVRAAISNTFGFGGHNASVLFVKFEN